MKRLKLAVVCACVFAIGVLLYCSGSEPSYGGKQLSQWLIDYSHGDPKTRLALMDALDHFGPRAIEPMVGWIGYQHPYWKQKVHSWIQALPLPGLFQPRLNDWMNRKQILARVSSETICLLGTNAGLAVPQLTQLSSSSNGMPAYLASTALQEIKENSGRLKQIRATIADQINQ